jgi:putative transposase
VCRLWGIHSKSIYKKTKDEVMGHYFKQTDDEIYELIKPIILARPTYGYKRVTAMLNRQRLELGLERYNKKRIYRIMRLKGAILPKTERTRDHQPTGVVMTLFSNTRWCSDGFEIKCFNGEKVYVAFVLDCCDREAISYVASSRPLIAENVQSLMISSVEKRFGEHRSSRQIEFLSDRGSIYRAYNVQGLARQLNLKSCFTAPYSPESNGMSEAFVNTIKRDYVYVNDCDTAENVMKMLRDWFMDYNQIAPHSALGMKSPVEYRLAINNG